MTSWDGPDADPCSLFRRQVNLIVRPCRSFKGKRETDMLRNTAVRLALCLFAVGCSRPAADFTAVEFHDQFKDRQTANQRYEGLNHWPSAVQYSRSIVVGYASWLEDSSTRSRRDERHLSFFASQCSSSRAIISGPECRRSVASAMGISRAVQSFRIVSSCVNSRRGINRCMCQL